MKRKTKKALSLFGAGGLMFSMLGPPALADCEWTGAGTDKKWETADNWTNCSGDAPGLGADAIFTVPASGHDTCEFDFPAYSVGSLSITGSSPTFFTFHVLDKDCLADSLDLNDYSRIDVDKVLLVDSTSPVTTLSGTIEMDIADIASEPLRNPEGYDLYISQAWIDGTDTILDVTTATNAYLLFDNLNLDVHDSTYGGAQRRLRIDGGTVVISDTFTVRSEPDTTKTANRAKFHLAGGSLTTDDMRVSAGTVAERHVEFDIDSNMTVTGTTTFADWDSLGVVGGGEVKIDVKADAVMDLGAIVLQGPCEIDVTGSVGIGQTPGKVISSD